MLQHRWTSKSLCWVKKDHILYNAIYIKCPEKANQYRKTDYSWLPGARNGYGDWLQRGLTWGISLGWWKCSKSGLAWWLHNSLCVSHSVVSDSAIRWTTCHPLGSSVHGIVCTTVNLLKCHWIVYFFFFWSLLTACGILVRWPGTELELWQWKHQILTTGLPENSPGWSQY